MDYQFSSGMNERLVKVKPGDYPVISGRSRSSTLNVKKSSPGLLVKYVGEHIKNLSIVAIVLCIIMFIYLTYFSTISEKDKSNYKKFWYITTIFIILILYFIIVVFISGLYYLDDKNKLNEDYELKESNNKKYTFVIPIFLFMIFIPFSLGDNNITKDGSALIYIFFFLASFIGTIILLAENISDF